MHCLYADWGSNWTGGHNYLLSLLDVLLRYQSAQLTPVLFMGEDVMRRLRRSMRLKGWKLCIPHI